MRLCSLTGLFRAQVLFFISLLSMNPIISFRNAGKRSMTTLKTNSFVRDFLSHSTLASSTNRIICGDSTDLATYKKLFVSESSNKLPALADALITDPPYCKLFFIPP